MATTDAAGAAASNMRQPGTDRPRWRKRVGDGTVDPSTLPYVPGTREQRTLTRDEYYEWSPPPLRRTLPSIERARPCLNVNCEAPRRAGLKFIKGRCRPCYEYWRRHGRKSERPLANVLKERDRRADQASEREPQLEAAPWPFCRNGHRAEPGDLDGEQRCRACRKAFYKTGRDRPFDPAAFIAANAEPADDRDMRERDAIWIDEAELSSEEYHVLAYLLDEETYSGPGDAGVPAWLAARHDDDYEEPDDDGDGLYLDADDLLNLH